MVTDDDTDGSTNGPVRKIKLALIETFCVQPEDAKERFRRALKKIDTYWDEKPWAKITTGVRVSIQEVFITELLKPNIDLNPELL